MCSYLLWFILLNPIWYSVMIIGTMDIDLSNILSFILKDICLFRGWDFQKSLVIWGALMIEYPTWAYLKKPNFHNSGEHFLSENQAPLRYVSLNTHPMEAPQISGHFCKSWH